MGEKFWHIKNCNLFEQLAEEEIAKIEGSSSLRTFQRKELVYLPSDSGDSVLLLVSGRIKMYHITSDGKQTLLAFIDPGEIFGELAIFEPGNREDFAETMEKSTVVLIPGRVIRELMNEKPVVSMQISRLMGMRRKRLERRLKSLLYRSTRERFIFLLLELAEKYGQQLNEGVLINIKLSHQELSSIIGSTRETVTNALIDLRDEGAINIQKRKIIVRNLSSLAASIDEDTPILPGTKPISNTNYSAPVRPVR
jgi:CRP/FNR family transcriptional regulator, cyclic AMP receptor protein